MSNDDYLGYADGVWSWPKYEKSIMPLITKWGPLLMDLNVDPEDAARIISTDEAVDGLRELIEELS